MKPQIGALYKKINYDEYALVLDVSKFRGVQRVTYIICVSNDRYNGYEHAMSTDLFTISYAPAS